MSFSAPHIGQACQPRPRLDPEPKGAPRSRAKGCTPLDPQRFSAASKRCCNCRRCPRSCYRENRSVTQNRIKLATLRRVVFQKSTKALAVCLAGCLVGQAASNKPASAGGFRLVSPPRPPCFPVDGLKRRIGQLQRIRLARRYIVRLKRVSCKLGSRTRRAMTRKAE